MAPKIAIIFYSLYGHNVQMAQAEKRGVEAAGGQADIYIIEETLPPIALEKMHAAPKPTDIPVLKPSDAGKLEAYDAFLFGVPTRYGNMSAQWKVFWDHTGKQWASGAFWGKYAGLFVSSGSPGGGQESTALACMSTLAHHGIIYVPLGYKTTRELQGNMDEMHGGSPWGAGCVAGNGGERQPTKIELAMAEEQGKAFYQTVSRVNFGAQ